jgi:hypothetical protein
VPDPSGAADFWDRSASVIIAGVIAHVLTTPGIRPELRTLYSVRDLLKNLGKAGRPKRVGGIGAFRLAERPRASTRRVSAGGG